MNPIFKLFRPNAMPIMLLLLLTLIVPKLWSQRIVKTDSICLCGSQKEIDSTLKILNDYPDQKQQLFLVSKLLQNERRLTELDRAAILKVLGLSTDWDLKRVKRRIWWLRYGRPVLVGLGGVGVGVLIGAVKF